MIICYQNPGVSSEFEVEGVIAAATLNQDPDVEDSLSFECHIRHIRRGAKITAYSDSGAPIFVGVVASIQWPGSGLTRYTCIPSESHLRHRIAPRVAYPGGVGLYLSDVLSSDPPPQAAGDNRYVAGLLWLARSAITSGIVEWAASGVGTLEGWDARTSGLDIYLDGHLLTEVSYSALTSGTYRCARTGDNLYVYGAGPGDVYGVVAADGFSENWLSLGDMASDPSIDGLFLLTDLDRIWPHVRDIIQELGLYPKIRRAGGMAYLDLLDSPYRLSTEADPLRSLVDGRDYIPISREIPKVAPHGAIIGVGANGSTQQGVRYGAGSPGGIGQAWTEERFNAGEARRPPLGNLDQMVDDVYSACQMLAPLKVDLLDESIKPGEWYTLGDLGAYLCQSVGLKSRGRGSAEFGAPALSLASAIAQRRETAAIEKYREYIEAPEDGEAVRYDYFGATETFSATFSTIDFGSETVPILISLEAVDETEILVRGGAVAYIININDNILRWPWNSWGPAEISDYDISDYCYLDGSENSISISIEDPSGWVPDNHLFQLTVTGLGADDPPDSVELRVNNSKLNDKSTSTYYTRSTLGYSTYAYYLLDESDPPVSLHPTVKVWARSKGKAHYSYIVNYGGVYWYGKCSTVLYISGSYYYGAAVLNSSAAWNSTTYATNPKTGSPWEVDEVNAVAAGGRLHVYNTSGLGWVEGDVYARLYDAYVQVLP